MGKKGIAALVIGISLFCAAGLIGFIFLVKAAGERRDARRAAELARQEAQEREEARAEAVAVFADPARPAPEDEAEFAAVFTALGQALDRGDTAAAAGAFDGDRMVRELEAIGAFDRVPGNGKRGFREGVRKGIDEKLGTMLVANEEARWTRTDVRHVRWSADRREVVVLTVHRNGEADDVPLRFRWWLVRRPSGWKIYDFEDMHLGLRGTRLIAALATPEMIERVGRDPLQFQTAVAGIREAIGLISKGDIEGADAALAPARMVPWPPPFRAVVELAEGMILMGRGDHAGALARFDEAERLLPGMPGNALARGSAFVALGRHDDAFAALRIYQKEVGQDALSCTLEGHVLEAQGKSAEAAAAYRRALDEVAESADAFNGLRRVLPAAQKKELGERLARLKDPHKLYNELVSAARDDGDDAAVEALLDGLRKVDPNDPRALGEDVRRQVKAEKFAEAAKLLARGLKLTKREDRESVLSAYLFAMLGADKALEAYAAVPAPHAERAFRTLAEDLEDDLLDNDDPALQEKRKRALSALIAAHRKRAPADAWIWYYEGAILQHAKEYEEAEKTFAAGAAKLPKAAPPEDPDDPDGRDWDADRFRSRRVLCLFKLKKGLDAYRAIGPPADTFHQLADLYDGEKDLDGLGALIAAHRASGVRDPERTYWQAHVLFRKGEYARAVPGYEAYLKESEERAPRRWAGRDELLRCVLRSKPADAKRVLDRLGADKVALGLRAATAAALGDRAELERLFAESTKNGGKLWFYSDEDFRRFIFQDRYRDLREKYPDPNPPPKVEG